MLHHDAFNVTIPTKFQVLPGCLWFTAFDFDLLGSDAVLSMCMLISHGDHAFFN